MYETLYKAVEMNIKKLVIFEMKKKSSKEEGDFV